MQETVSASKKLGRDDALALAREARRLVAAKGKRVTVLDLTSTRLSDDEVAALMLGPTGNLRAPTLRVGQTLLVGYNEHVFDDELA